MRAGFSRSTFLAIALLPALLSPADSRAAWPTSPTVNLPICTAADLQSGSTVASDMSGGVFVAWQDRRGGTETDVYAQRAFASGIVDPQWPVNGALVCGATGSQLGTRVVSDGAGGVILAWSDARTGSALDIYAHHLFADGSLDPVWPAGGRAVCTAPGIQSAISISSDAAGGAVLAWRDTRNDTDLYAARVLANGQLDPSWAADGVPIAIGPGAQLFAQATSDGSGGLVVVWQDTRSGATPDVYAQRLLVNGSIAPGWPVNGIAVCTASGTQQLPNITSDGAGGAIAAWEDQRGGTAWDIYTHHVRADGTLDPAWPVDGRAVCAAAGDQTRAKVVGDASGGAFVAWTDARAGSIPALYAQHVLSNGALDPAWPIGDLGFNLMFGDHMNLMLLPDGTGGALAVWSDGRSGRDVYAHHLLVGGTVDPAWPTNGRAVSTAPNSQNVTESAIPDGSGGLIVAWTDGRPAPALNDIYAQRVQADGQLGGTVLDVQVAGDNGLRLAPLSPTPVRGDRFGLRFRLPREGSVSVELLDVTGRRVTGHDLGLLPAGQHAIDWNAGVKVTPGIHWLRLRFGSEVRTVRAVALE